MAPQQLEQLPERVQIKKLADTGAYKDQVPGREAFKAEQEHAEASYPKYLPVWDETQHYPPLTDFDHVERGIGADPCFKDLLVEGSERNDIGATIGSEVRGVQLSKLSDAGKAQLALFVAQRKVVAFRDQDFADLPIQEALDFVGFFGRHHIHPASGAPKGYPEVHIVHRGKGDKQGVSLLAQRTSTVAWHSDVTYEKQPPGTTFLYVLDKPKIGGDTLFVDMVEAYRRLSPGFRERLHGLEALHSGFEQSKAATERGSIIRRDPIATYHPLVRTHPATGEKALFINSQFTRSIKGYKQEESDCLLKMLYDHIAFGADFQARMRWEPKTVVVWDNRVTSHSALLDWVSGEQRRHLARITPQAEKPYETPFNLKAEEEEDEKRMADFGVPILNC